METVQPQLRPIITIRPQGWFSQRWVLDFQEQTEAPGR